MPQKHHVRDKISNKSNGDRVVPPPSLWKNIKHRSLLAENVAAKKRPKQHYVCVPSNFMANWRVPKFFLNNCAQSSKKTFMCPKFHTNPVFKDTKCHISTNLSNFVKLCSLYCQKLFALAPTNCRFAEKKSA